MVKLIVQVTPQEIYNAFPPKIKELTDSLVKSLMNNGCFDTEQQARDWATAQIYNSIKTLSKEQT